MTRQYVTKLENGWKMCSTNYQPETFNPLTDTFYSFSCTSAVDKVIAIRHWYSKELAEYAYRVTANEPYASEVRLLACYPDFTSEELAYRA